MNILQPKYARLAAYALIVILTVLAFARLDSQQSKIETLLNERTEIRNAQAAADCANQRITREGLRNSVITTATLGRTLVGEPTTPQQASALKQIDAYEQGQLRTLPPLECPVPPSPPAESSISE